MRPLGLKTGCQNIRWVPQLCTVPCGRADLGAGLHVPSPTEKQIDEHNSTRGTPSPNMFHMGMDLKRAMHAKWLWHIVRNTVWRALAAAVLFMSHIYFFTVCIANCAAIHCNMCGVSTILRSACFTCLPSKPCCTIVETN